MLKNLLLPLVMILIITGLDQTLGFLHPFGGVLISFALYFLAQLIRKNEIFTRLGLPPVDSPGDFSASKLNTTSFLVRKSMWVLIPLLYLALSKGGSLGDFGLIVPLINKTQIIIIVILAALSLLMYNDAKSLDLSLGTYLKSFTHALLAAGLPEDFLILGVIGGSVFRLFSLYLPNLGASTLTVLVVESLFTLSHIPTVKKAHDFYSEKMTTKPNMTYKRMFIQMFIFSLPGWLFYFLSSHIFFSIWWHSLGDIAAFLPPKTEK